MSDLVFSTVLPCTIIALVSGLVHGYSGFGGALLMIPLLSLFLAPLDAVALTVFVALLGQIPVARQAFQFASWGDCVTPDWRPAHYRITAAGVQMLIDQVWVRVPNAAIQYRLLGGDHGTTLGGHWCGRRANDIDALNDGSGEGYFTFCAFLPPGVTMNSSYDLQRLTTRHASAR